MCNGQFELGSVWGLAQDVDYDDDDDYADVKIIVNLCHCQVCNGRSLSRGQCEDGSDEDVDCCLEEVQCTWCIQHNTACQRTRKKNTLKTRVLTLFCLCSVSLKQQWRSAFQMMGEFIFPQKV